MHETWFAIFSDKNHIIAELLWQLIFDGFAIAFLYGFVVKKIIIPRLRLSLHKEIDEEHGITHKEKQ